MNLFKKKEKKTYKYEIEFKNGKKAEGKIKATSLYEVYSALFKNKVIETNNGLFYWNSDEFLTVKVYEED